MDHKIIYLEWVDACDKGGWVATDDVACNPIIQSAGLLVAETPESLVISTSFCAEHNQWIAPLTIPKIAIRKKSVLHAKRKAS